MVKDLLDDNLDGHVIYFCGETANTTREKASSSAGFRCISSAGRGATNKALQLTHSSSAWSPALLLHKCSSSAVSGNSLLLVALARFAWTHYC